MVKCVHRLKPFTREPGTEMLLPGTCDLVKVFPTHAERGAQVIDFGVKGVISRFMAMNDLERNEIVISGTSSEGPYQHILKGNTPKERSRLHLGCHKAQDWLLMRRRSDMREFLPFWHRLGQNLPETVKGEMIDSKNRLEAQSWLLDQFRLRFEGNSLNVHSLEWLKGSSAWIEKLFLHQEEETLFLLQTLPPQLHAGRLLGAELKGFKIDMEWTKKEIRKLILYPSLDQELILKTSNFFKACRINGIKTSLNKKIKFKSGNRLIFDCFY